MRPPVFFAGAESVVKKKTIRKRLRKKAARKARK
jgi:hypothetical protein